MNFILTLRFLSLLSLLMSLCFFAILSSISFSLCVVSTGLALPNIAVEGTGSFAGTFSIGLVRGASTNFGRSRGSAK